MYGLMLLLALISYAVQLSESHCNRRVFVAIINDSTQGYS